MEEAENQGHVEIPPGRYLRPEAPYEEPLPQPGFFDFVLGYVAAAGCCFAVAGMLGAAAGMFWWSFKLFR